MLRLKRSVLIILSLLLIAAVYFPNLFVPSLNKQLEDFQKAMHLKEELANGQLDKLIQWENNRDLELHTTELEELFSKQGISFFIVEDEVLKYWSEDISVLSVEELLDNSAMHHSTNAWQYKCVQKKGNKTFIALVLIKYNFTIKNEFLSKEFQKEFQFSLIQDISLKEGEGQKIESINGQTLFSLIPSEKYSAERYFLFYLFLIGILLLFIQLSLISAISIFQSISIAILLRLLLFFFPPETFEALSLFRSSDFAISNLIPSLGDFLLHSILLFYLSIRCMRLIQHYSSRLTSSIVFISTLVLAVFFPFLIEHCIEASQVNFDLNNLFLLDIFSLLALLSIVLLYFSLLLLIRKSFLQLKEKQAKKFLLAVSLSILALTLGFIYLSSAALIHLWVFPLLFLFYLDTVQSKFNLLAVIISLLVYVSATTAFIVNQKAQEKEKNERPLILQKLAEEKDPIAEYLFADLQNQIRKDERLKKESNSYWNNKEELDSYLKKKYFGGYFDKYQINFSLCDLQDSLYINDWNSMTSCIDYFRNRIRVEGDQLSSDNLYQLQNLAGRVDYIGEIALQNEEGPYKIYVELSSNFFNENEGYPELLLDQKSKTLNWDLSQYAYAVYDKGELIFKDGGYNYSTRLRINELSVNTFYQYTTEKFQHLAYQKDEHITIVLSKERITFYNFLTAMAYLLILFALIFFLLSILLKEFIYDFQINLTDFTVKIQLFLVLSLLSALLLLAWGTTFYIKQQYQDKNGSQLEEKIRSVNIELENKIASEEFLSLELEGYVGAYLVKFSNVFYSDINLYDKSGKLYSSSRPEVFSKGLKSKRMHPGAFQAMIGNEKAQWVQTEKVGELEYLSAYIPFRNYNNEILGYLNLPYFARQGALQAEISSFLVSTINIYVGIFVLALLISVLLVNQLSKPLLLIRQQISKLSLGSSIELIDWKSKDEIGALVKEYNRIAIELSESAERLAQSQREEAWREMAKQVAHEIKNPLTPMKLNIQQLQRYAEANVEGLSERINKTAQILIEQIETLNNIASAFSSFARLPENISTKVNLLTIVKNAAELYSTEASIGIDYEEVLEEIEINGDKDQLLRLFNNIIKNAVQATESNNEAKIQLKLSRKEDLLEITIEDNGVGIGEEQMHRIFEPNFTTKTSGTGLGLAMSKSIIEQMQGTIEVKSTLGKGTSFTITFPIA